MEPKYTPVLDRLKQVAQWYLDHSTLYKRQIPIDIDLSTASKPKMRSLIEEFISRVSEFIKALETARPTFSRVDEGVSATTKDTITQFEVLEDEFNKIHKTFEKLSVTTPKLLDIKRKIDEKIKLYENLQRKNVMSRTPRKIIMENSRSHSRVKEPDVNEKWLDSLMQDVSQRNDKIKEFTRMGTAIKKKQDIKGGSSIVSRESPRAKPAKDISTYLTGFKMIQDEFSDLKTQIQQLTEIQRSHTHKPLEEHVNKLTTETMKIAADNKVIQREHSELLHTLHVLSKRVDLLEKENGQLKDLLHKIVARKEEPQMFRSISEQRSAQKPSYTISATATKMSPKPIQIEAQKRVDELTGVSDWVIERLKK